MVAMTNQEITEYLKQIATLESAVFKQEEIIKTANKNLVKKQFSKPTLEKPEVYKINPPIKKDEIHTTGKILGGCFGFAFIFPLLTGSISTIPVIFFVIGIIIFAAGIASDYNAKKQDEEIYNSNMQEYNRQKSEAELEYRKALERNQRRYDNEMAVYRKNNNIANINYQKAQQEVMLLDEPLLEAKRLLAQLYEKDIIFPKYRNLIAMCTMYEYFASGRCSELTGANGAYNIFEQESRQNVIIYQLEQVNRNLEQVKQNQYILYQTIRETNQALQEISADIKGIVNAVTDIAVSSRVAAYCSQIIATNAQVQTYLAILD